MLYIDLIFMSICSDDFAEKQHLFVHFPIGYGTETEIKTTTVMFFYGKWLI